ncbi:MAG TPA: hypothetical protein VF177_21810 [Anaerolineae bacterium]
MANITQRRARQAFALRAGRLPLLGLGGLSLLAALWAGLVRLGWPLPALPLVPVAHHGVLMASGFLGTLICLERAVALRQNLNRRGPYYLAPLLSGLGALALLVGLPTVVGRMAMMLGALGLVLIFAIIVRIQPDVAVTTMAAGAFLWLVGNGLWLVGWPVYRIVPWWAGFLILTIAGERLELARILRPGRNARIAFLVATALFLAGLLLSLLALDLGLRLSGFGLLALGLWLLRFDLARRTIRQKGLTRFIATCLLPGYVWLILGGVLWLIYGGQHTAGLIYDATLHVLFLGFVISMVFAHAPVIVPALLGTPVSYRPHFYLHLILLHLSLVIRVAGDLLGWLPGRRWGGLFNVVAMLLFLALMAIAVRPGQPHDSE